MQRGYILGLLCILAVALIWSGSSVLVQAIFTTADFRKPFFLTFVSNSLFMVTLPIRAVALFLRRKACSGESERDALNEAPTGMWSPPVWHAAKSGMLVAPVWFAANCTYNFSMSMTSITSSTIISSSSSAFTSFLRHHHHSIVTAGIGVLVASGLLLIAALLYTKVLSGGGRGGRESSGGTGQRRVKYARPGKARRHVPGGGGASREADGAY